MHLSIPGGPETHSSSSPQDCKCLAISLTLYCPVLPRRDKALLSDTFETLAYDLTISDLIEQGALCKVWSAWK